MANGPQKPDTGGNFFMTPRKVVGSIAWRQLSNRARAILQAFQYAHDGFNNGRIKMGIHQLGAFVGNQNHDANSRAVAELIEMGFLECVSDANHHQSKAREYRITFIASGKEKAISPATNDYLEWRPKPGMKRKFGPAKSAMESEVAIAGAANSRKLSCAVLATSNSETLEISTPCHVAATAPILGNQSSDLSPAIPIAGSRSSPSSEGVGVDLHELRGWMKDVIDQLGYGGQKTLALDARVPEPAISKFKRGRSLPARYHLDLQMACGRHLPYRRWRAMRPE